jgi:hypothetical protein
MQDHLIYKILTPLLAIPAIDSSLYPSKGGIYEGVDESSVRIGGVMALL